MKIRRTDENFAIVLAISVNIIMNIPKKESCLK